jgi:PhnB protein
MVNEITPYLFFDGKCEEALNYYKKMLGGEVKQMIRVSDGPKEYQDPKHSNKIMHSVLQAGKASFMASDSMGYPATTGSNTVLNLSFETAKDIDTTWNNMKEGSKITMELQDTFWGARFGTLTDKYGINWMFNYDKK